MTPEPLDDHFVPARVAIKVTLHQPLPRDQHQVITGHLLGTMHARGRIHHYRVAVAPGVVYFAPPSWVAPESTPAVERAARNLTSAEYVA